MVDRAPSPAVRVLVVDDMQDFANSMVLLLRLWKYDALAVYDSSAAVDAARTYRPHIAFIDLVMPQMDGYALAKRLRQEPDLEDTLFVAVTGLMAPAHRTRCLEEGFVHFLEKPLNLPELQQLLAELVEAHAGLATP